MARFEIKLLDVRMVRSQGPIEGAFELTGTASLVGGSSIVWPLFGGETSLPVGGVRVLNRRIGVVEVGANETRVANVRLAAVEHDNAPNPDESGKGSVSFVLVENGGELIAGAVLNLAANGQLPLENRGRIQVRVAATPLDA